MTRKHYQAAADIVRNHQSFQGLPRTHQEWMETQTADAVSFALEEAFVEFFRNDNPRFDEKKFRQACNKKDKQ